MTITKNQAVLSLRPEGGFSVTEDGIVEYLIPDGTEPSESEIQIEMIRLQEEYDTLQYQRDRQYPTWQEQMDMQYHDLLDGTTTWKDAVAKVKSDNPKE
jgi:hypothetical protein